MLDEKYQDCLNLTEAALAKEPDIIQAFVYRGLSFYNLDKFTEAEKELRAAASMELGCLPAQYYLALTLDKLSEKRPALLSEAKMRYEAVLIILAHLASEYVDDGIKATHFIAHSNLANICEYLGLHADAHQHNLLASIPQPLA